MVVLLLEVSHGIVSPPRETFISSLMKSDCRRGCLPFLPSEVILNDYELREVPFICNRIPMERPRLIFHIFPKVIS